MFNTTVKFPVSVSFRFDCSMQRQKTVTLKHIYYKETRWIGLKFYPDKVLQALVKTLPSPKWHQESGCVIIKNTKGNLSRVFNMFKGVAWVNCKHFFTNKPVNTHNPILSVDCLRKRKLPQGYRICPEDYFQKLELRKYSLNTAKAYVACFEGFINHYKDTKDLMALTEIEIKAYLQTLVQSGKSDSYINQAINAVKFYYETVQGMPNRFYHIERPIKAEKLPEVLSKQEVRAMIGNTANIKHRCIISLLYSAGLRRGELLALKPKDIDSQRMAIHVEGGKGNKACPEELRELILCLVCGYYQN